MDSFEYLENMEGQVVKAHVRLSSFSRVTVTGKLKKVDESGLVYWYVVGDSGGSLLSFNTQEFDHCNSYGNIINLKNVHTRL
jgi:hypothetical protein